LIALQGNSSESLLEEAKNLEKKYEWLHAAEFYKQVFASMEKDGHSAEVANFCERLGYSLFRAALQATTNEQFQSRMLQAANANEKAATLYQKSINEKSAAKSISYQAKAIYARSWIETDPVRKRDLLDQWWSLNSKAIEIFDRIGDHIAVAQTCNDMMEGSWDCRYWVAQNWSESAKIRKELISLGEKALGILSNTSDTHELARTLCWLSCFYASHNVTILEEKKEIVETALAYSKKAMRFSKKTHDAWLIGWSHFATLYICWMKNEPSQNIFRQWIKYGEITRDNYLIGVAKIHLINSLGHIAMHEEDPIKNREASKHSLALVPEAIRHLEIINMVVWNPYFASSMAFLGAASIELDIETKKAHLKRAAEYAKKSIEVLEGWHQSNIPMMIENLSEAFYQLSEIENNPVEKRRLIENLLETAMSSTRVLEDYPNNLHYQIMNSVWMILSKAALAKISTIKDKIDLLNAAVSSINTCLKEIKLFYEKFSAEFHLYEFGEQCYRFGGIFSQLYSLIKERSLLSRAIEIYDFAVTLFDRVELTSEKAACFWQRAKIQVHLGNHLEAAKDYELASGEYLKAIQKIPSLREFYKNHSLYMLAWTHIEKARYNHNKEDYSQSIVHYREAASLIEKSDSWSYLASNYYAWEQLEKGEDLSRKEEPPQAISSFKLAIQHFKKAEQSIKTKNGSFVSSEEKDQVINLIKASNLRQRYCQARISMEEAKLLDREGKYLGSSISYGRAAQIISTIVDETDVEAERKELRYLAVLCRAWEKMANAEETTSFEPYMEAALLFEDAKGYCFTRKASLWVLGNSNFCKGLAAGLRYKSSMDLKENALAKRYINDAATSYQQAGFENASEYARATLRLFDAYVYMNQAEGEVDPEKKAKQYQMAENLLQIAADSFMKAKQPEKTAQVQTILANVKQEKALAVSLSQVMQAPTIASSTLSFAAPTPTKEVSIGLENFEHANVQANLVTTGKQVKVGECFCLSVEFVNAGREPALLLRVDDFVPQDFVVVKKPEIYRIEKTTLNMKGKQLAPLKLVEVKLTLQPSKKGDYTFNPRVQYLDELGQNKSLQLKTLEIKVEEIILEDRVSSGTEELDSLLLGGIPEEYSVVLSGPPCDEREMMVKNFLDAGITQKEVTFYVATEATGLESLLDNPNFYLFLCNPKPKTSVPDSPNVYRLQSKSDITNLGIALTKAIRNINQSITRKRICVYVLSDVLVNQGTKTTREWISGLITDLGAKGFTMLSIVNPRMHTSEELYAVLDLFDGEISIIQSDDPLDCKKSILVKKLRNQDYIKNPICLT